MKQNNIRPTLVILLILLLIGSVFFALYKINTNKNYDIIPNIIKNDTEYVIESNSLENMFNYLFADDFKSFNIEKLKNYNQIQATLYQLYSDTVLFEKIKQGATVLATYADGNWILLTKSNFRAASYSKLETGSLLGYTYISPKKINKQVLSINSKESETAIASMANTSAFHILEKTKLNDMPQWISHDFYFSNTNLEIISFYIPASQKHNKLHNSNSAIIKTFTDNATSYNYKFKDNKAISKLTRKANIENKIPVTEIATTIPPTETFASTDNQTETTSSNEGENLSLAGTDASNGVLFSAKSNIIFGPQLVKNHTNARGNILIQDQNNTLYFITTDGNKKWSAKLDGPIIGECSEVDFYNNNKVQYLCNTESRLYLFDINGNKVKGFPVIIPTKAKSKIQLFHSNSNLFHIYYAGIDDKAYILRSNKNDLKVIKSINNIAEGKNIIQLVSVAKANYIAILKHDGSISFFTTSGTEYFNTDTKFKTSINSKIFENNTNSKANLISNDNKGRLSYLHKGKTTQFVEFGNFNEANTMFYEDINKDKREDFIFADQTHTTAYDRFKKEIFSVSYNLNNVPEVKSFNSDSHYKLLLFAAGELVVITYNKANKKTNITKYNSNTMATVISSGLIIANGKTLDLR